jgi:hypothetical protein
VAEGGGLLSRTQPTTETVEFSLFDAGFLHRTAQRAGTDVTPFVSPPHQTKKGRGCDPAAKGKHWHAHEYESARARASD